MPHVSIAYDLYEELAQLELSHEIFADKKVRKLFALLQGYLKTHFVRMYPHVLPCRGAVILLISDNSNIAYNEISSLQQKIYENLRNPRNRARFTSILTNQVEFLHCS